MTYTDQILELLDRKPAHPDPKVDRAILRTEVEDVLYRVSGEDEIARLSRQVESLWKEYRVYLKKTSSTPQFIEERQRLVDSVSREKRDG